MNGADILFVCFVVYGLIFGLRRGFYKELIAFTALVVAVAAARTWRVPAGELIHSRLSFLPAALAHGLGAFLVWVVAFFAINLIGRILLKKLKNPDGENKLEKAAEEVADAVEGDTKPGPMTLLTNPVATAQKEIVYWTDKVLGGLLGIVKGAAAAYAIFAVVYFAGLQTTSVAGLESSIETSKAAALYEAVFAGFLEKLPEYRLIENAAKMQKLVDETKKDPKAADRAAQHPNWIPVKNTAAFKQLALDPEVQALWSKKDLDGLIRSAKVRHLLTDEQFQDVFEDVDVDAVLDSLAAPPPPPPKRP